MLWTINSFTYDSPSTPQTCIRAISRESRAVLLVLIIIIIILIIIIIIDFYEPLEDIVVAAAADDGATVGFQCLIHIDTLTCSQEEPGVQLLMLGFIDEYKLSQTPLSVLFLSLLSMSHHSTVSSPHQALCIKY